MTTEQNQTAEGGPLQRVVRPLADRLRECADEVMEFPHPSACDHLHVAFAVMREAADELERLTKQGEVYTTCESHRGFSYTMVAQIGCMPPLKQVCPICAGIATNVRPNV